MWRFPLGLVLIALILVVACNSLQLENQPSHTPTPTKTPIAQAALGTGPTAIPTFTPTDAPAASPTASPNVAAAAPVTDGNPGIAATPIPTFTPLPPTFTPSPEPTATDTPEPSSTPTPVPTFTPPPMGAASVAGEEHYWLERPIPPDYANWTDRIYPYGATRGGLLRPHHGVEFINPEGVPVLAAADGVVVTAGSDNQVLFGPEANFYGNLVAIRHNQTYKDQYLYTVYGHLSQILVSEGQPVAMGDMIGLVGGTGVANGGAHLHFEVRVGENRYENTRNPELWLRPFYGWGTIAGRLLWPDGSYIYEASLSIDRADDPNRFVNRTIYTYADDSVNPDDLFKENFTTPDLEPGPYLILFRDGTNTYQELVWVYPNQTSLATIQIGSLPPPAADSSP